MTDITDLKHVNTENTYMIVKRNKPSFVKELNVKCIKYDVRNEVFRDVILEFSLLELLSINQTKFKIENIADDTNSDEQLIIKLNLEDKTLQMYKEFQIQFYVKIRENSSGYFLRINPHINNINSQASTDEAYFKIVNVSAQHGGGAKNPENRSRKDVHPRNPENRVVPGNPRNKRFSYDPFLSLGATSGGAVADRPISVERESLHK